MKNKSQTIFLSVLLLGVCLSIITYIYVYQPKLKATEELKATNDTLQERVDILEAFYKEMPKNLEEIENSTKDIIKKTERFPADVKEEDIIYLALRAANIKDASGKNTYNEPLPVIVVGGEEDDNKDNKKTTAKAKKEEKDEEANADNPVGAGVWLPVIYKDIAVGEKEDFALIPVDVVNAAAIDELRERDSDGNIVESAYVFKSRTVTYTHITTYSAMKEIIKTVNDNPEQLAITNLSYVLNNEGALDGSLEVTFYSVAGMGKKYEPRKFNDYQIGLTELFLSSGEVGFIPEVVPVTDLPEEEEEETVEEPDAGTAKGGKTGTGSKTGANAGTKTDTGADAGADAGAETETE